MILALVVAGNIRAEAAGTPWKVVKASHFIVHYRSDEPFAREVARAADACYTRIASDLGYKRYSNFWLWDSRARIFIYPTREEFEKVPGTREWSLAVSVYDKKEIHSFSAQPNLIDGVLPHEITHLIFRDFVGTSSAIPLWIDEGVAQWEEPARRELAKKYVRSLIKGNALLPLNEVFTTNSRGLGTGKRVEKFYVQSVSLIDFLIDRGGGSAFTDFCRMLRDGKPVEEAIRKTYPSITTAAKLESEWRTYAATLAV